jgi:flavin reductase (DIM6/NTAB) family NADH-FMN oxidoreductase RutF
MMYTNTLDGTFGAEMGVDPEAFKAVMSQWPSGVTVVTTRDADGPHGMTASSFSSVSLDPPLVSVCIARHLHSHDRIADSGVFAVNILDKAQVDLGLRFAGMLEGVENRFAGIDTTTAPNGAPLLDGTLGWVDCRVWQAYDGGDHTIFVGEVLAAGSDASAAPLLYHSRSWGQFADVLATEVTVTTVEDDNRDAVVVEAAFGTGPDAPADVDTIVARVDAHLVDGPTLLVLDDTPSAADPMQVRQVLQALSGHVGRTGIALRAGTGPMALANVLVALKSGVHDLQASTTGAALSLHDLAAMLDRMGVIMRTPSHT